ncbi:hypothetical protein BGW39_007163 [Mortierella sp. 14UC]|nr:hypothetical protein BGW39_007163 [Mortierella sp. 14UC]
MSNFGKSADRMKVAAENRRVRQMQQPQERLKDQDREHKEEVEFFGVLPRSQAMSCGSQVPFLEGGRE